MTTSAERVYVHGRLRGLTRRRLEQLSAAAGLALTRGTATADTIVVGHSAASRAVSDGGELRLGFRSKPDARLVSEHAFRSRLGLGPPPAPGAHLGGAASRRPAGETPALQSGQHDEDQVARHTGLRAAQLRTLALFDVLAPVDGRYSYADLVAARAAGQLFAAGVGFPKIIAASLALERRGERLSSVRLAEAPWGEVLQVMEGALAEIDGQLLLPLEGSNLDVDGAFALAEQAEQDGDLGSARRWYELAARLDATDPVISFNLGNVLDELGLAREAEIAYRQAIARGPDMADAWFNMGVLLEKTCRETEALAAYERALAIDPAYADALHNAALLHMRGRRFAEAARLLERVRATSPPNAAEIQRLAHLCRLEARRAETRE
jgi:tetratricopeptide (TPR) repeat protein